MLDRRGFRNSLIQGSYAKGYGRIFACSLYKDLIILSDAIPKKYRPVVLAHEITEGRLYHSDPRLRYAMKRKKPRIFRDREAFDRYFQKYQEDNRQKYELRDKFHFRAIEREMQEAKELGIKEDWLRFVDKWHHDLTDPSGLKKLNLERRIRGLPLLYRR